MIIGSDLLEMKGSTDQVGSTNSVTTMTKRSGSEKKNKLNKNIYIKKNNT